MTNQLGYTLTDCYIGNANYGCKQKQMVVITHDSIVPFTNYLNGPSDSGRSQQVIPIRRLTEQEVTRIFEIKKMTDPKLHESMYKDWAVYDQYIDKLKGDIVGIVDESDLEFL